MNSRAIIRGVLLAVSLSLSSFAGAQNFPTHPVRIIVTYSPGGPSDIIARLLASKLSERWGHQVFVENIPGAGGNTGYGRAARAPADGYTLVAMAPGFTVNQSLYSKLPFDPLKDFEAVTLVAGSPTLVLINPSIPATNMKELIALIQKTPGKFSYAHPSAGTISHLLGELLKQRYKLDLATVPFTGTAAAITSTLGGFTQIALVAVPGAQPYVIAGTLRALAVTSSERNQTLPNVPTMQEAGISDMEGETLSGILVPAGVPKEIVMKIHQDISWALSQPDFRKRLIELGFDPKGDGPEKFQTIIKSEIAKWAKIIRDADIPKFN